MAKGTAHHQDAFAFLLCEKQIYSHVFKALRPCAQIIHYVTVICLTEILISDH